jgi:hypothetical protein
VQLRELHACDGSSPVIIAARTRTRGYAARMMTLSRARELDE